MLTCKQVSQLVSQSCERRLTWRERLGVRLHLLICEACARFERQMRFLRIAARRFASGEAAGRSRIGLSANARRRIAEALRRR